MIRFSNVLGRIAMSMVVLELIVDVLWGVTLLSNMEPNMRRTVLNWLITFTLISSVLVLGYSWFRLRVGGALPTEPHVRLAVVAPATAALAMEVLSLFANNGALGVDMATMKMLLWITLVIATIGDLISAYQTSKA